MQQSTPLTPAMTGAPTPATGAITEADSQPAADLGNVTVPQMPQREHGFNQTTNVNVHVGAPSIHFNSAKSGPSFAVRALWFVAIGWWLSGLFIIAGYVLTASILLLPVGFWFLNRIPQAQTLRPRTREITTEFRDNAIVFTEGTKKQIAWYLRLLYLPAGLVIGAIWLSLAWVTSLTVIGLPLSVMMIDRAPTMITLEQN